ncbi:MAG TPA: stage V sporulation protein R [Syntrophomonas sp.]|jgi:stage V sporulation protein R|nr:stage V sporulation protein R [Syntrophomonas sp.]HCF71726.1 stage V sporulation protein R [Syntrophomonas sp.]
MGGDYSLADLRQWDERICQVVEKAGLGCYPQEFEICSYEDMLGYEAYQGMPARYSHWSFGKAYERTRTFYRYNLVGLPYEMVINSNPCLAYLMKDNTLLLQILTMAHVYAHNDFFKNNRLFKTGTRAEYTLEMFKSHARRIQQYVADPGIGAAKVEKVLDAAHALRLQVYRTVGEKWLSDEEKKQRLIERSQVREREHPLLELPEEKELPDLNRIPLEPEEDLLLFLYKYGRLNDWERDILQIVREESLYFLPQIETKIMNEGWASYWHYRLLKQLKLPQELHLEFLKRHNQVIRPLEGDLNPYHIGFKIFEELEREHPDEPDFIFAVREHERDFSFLMRFLTRELCQELKLFQYAKRGRDYVVNEVSDEKGWKIIRNTLAGNVGISGIPNIIAMEVKGKNNTLMLDHEWSSRELNMEYAHQTLKHIAFLWKGKVQLRTVVRTAYQLLESDGG